MKKIKKDAKNLIVLGVGLGVGAQAIGSVGGNTAAVTAMSNKLPMVATITMGSHVVRHTKKLMNKKKKRSRRFVL